MKDYVHFLLPTSVGDSNLVPKRFVRRPHGALGHIVARGKTPDIGSIAIKQHIFVCAVDV